MWLRHHPAALLFGLLGLLLGQLIFGVGAPVVWRALAGTLLHLLGAALIWIGIPAASAEPASRLSRSGEGLAIAGLTILAAAARLIWLDRLPFKIDGDAAAFALSAADFLTLDPPPLFATGWQAHTNVYFWLESWSLRLWGRTVFGLRFGSALGGTLSVPAIWWLGREVGGPRLGLLAALALTALPFHLVFSRVGTEVIQMSWITPLVAVCLLRGWREDRWRWSIAGGALIGLSQYIYPGARLIPLLAAAQIGLMALFPPERQRSWRRVNRSIGGAALGCALIYGPIVPYYLAHPQLYTQRIAIVSIFASGWLAEQLRTRPLLNVLGEQIWRAYLPFHYPVGGSPLWYVWPQYLRPIDAVLSLAGAVAIIRAPGIASWAKRWLIVYLGGGIILAGVLTIDTPMPSRYVIFLPAIALLIGAGMGQAMQAARRLGSRRPDMVSGAIAGALAAYLLTGAATYYRHDTEAILSHDHTGHVVTHAARFLQQQPDDHYDILFLHTDLVYYQANPALAFLTGKDGENLEEPLSCAALQRHETSRRLVIIAPPERLSELEAFAQRLSEGNLTVLSDERAQPIAGVLDLPPHVGASPRCSAPPAEPAPPP